MKGLFKRLSVLAASLAMVFGVGLVNNEKNAKAASSETLTVTNFQKDETVKSKTVSLTSCTAIWEQNSSTNAINTTYAQIRLYASHSLTFNIKDGYSIQSIVATASSNSYATALAGKSLTGATKSVSGSTVTITPTTDATSIVLTQTAQSRITQFVINYDVAGAQTVALDKTSSIMKVKDSLTLNATASEEGATISWESSDTEVATVADGVVTALKSGTTTITATFGTASATCKILVNDHSGTSVDDPLTIAEAIASIDFGSTDKAYVKGIVVSKTFDSTYYSEMWVSDDGTTTNQFEFYKFYAGADSATFDSDIIRVGDTIVGYGTLKKFYSTYELDSGCYLAQRIEKPFSIIGLSGITNGATYYVGDTIKASDITVTGVYEDNTEVEIETGYTVDPELPYTFTSSDVGSKTITVTYEDLTDSVTVTVKEKPADLMLVELTITEGENVKKTYYIGDSIDTTGLTVTAGYLSESDSDHESYVDVTDKVTWTLDTTVANTEAHLTASFTDGEVTETAYIVVVVREGLSDEYELVKDVNDLSENDMIVIAAQSASVAMSSTQNGNNRPSTTITKSENSITASDGTQRIILKKGTKDNTFALSVDEGFLYAASTSSNYLRTESTLSDNSSWTITITSTGVATITAQGTNTRNGLKYNSSSKIFSCYASGQAAVVIYKYYASADAKNLVKTIEDADTCTDYVNVNTYLTSYDALSSEGKIFVDRSFISDVSLDGETVEITCRTKLDFMSARYAAQQGSSNAKFNLYSSSTTNVSFVLIIGIVGLGSILGYYFINKRRMLSK